MGKLPAAAAQRHVAVARDFGADRRRHQAVDLPLAGRRLEDPPQRGAQGAGRGRNGGGRPAGELPLAAHGRAIQQRGDRPHRRRRQPPARHDPRRGGRLRSARRGRLRRTAGHARRRLPRPCADAPARRHAPGLCLDRRLRRTAARRGAHLRAAGQGIRPVRHPDPRAGRDGRREGRRRAARLQTTQHRSPPPLRRDDAGGARGGQRPDRRVRHRRLPARHEPRRLARTGRLQPLSRPRVRPPARRRRAALLPLDPSADARGGVRADRHAPRPRAAPHADRLPAGRARADHRLRGREDRRHPALPPLVGRAGQRALVERRAERADCRDHHRTQGQRARAARRNHPLLLVAARPQIGRRRDEHRLGRGPRRRRGGCGTLPGEV